tara:strand:+ start:2036 stop:2992 length:957 start_codon:yes stop_codon:yes gene_type:complete
MKLGLEHTDLQPIQDIEIPDRFFNRIKSGVVQLDMLFGNGILPGSTGAMSATPGCGKTTFMMQLLDALGKQAYECAYITAEECVEQLAFSARRLNVEGFHAAHKTGMTEILELMDDLDLLIIDSYQGIQPDTDELKAMSNRAFLNHATDEIINKAQATDTAVLFILHVTVSGNSKGGTDVLHKVDAVFKMKSINDETRQIWSEKNRFGATYEYTCYFGHSGFDFDKDVNLEELENAVNAAKMNDSQKKVLAALEANGPLPFDNIVIHTGLEANKGQKARAALYQLTKEGYIDKNTSRPATWKLPEQDFEGEAVVEAGE